MTNIGQEDLTFTIRQPHEAFTIKGAGTAQTLKSGQSKLFSVVCNGSKITGKGIQELVEITSNATNVESGFGLTLFADNGGICYNFFPEDGATIEGTSVNVGCKVSHPWGGELVMQVSVSDKADMSSIVKKVRVTLLGQEGSNSTLSTSISGLQANKKYYWRVSYFDYEDSYAFVDCSPVMSFVTGAE